MLKKLLALFLALLIISANCFLWAWLGFKQGRENPNWEEWTAWVDPTDCSINLMDADGNWYMLPFDEQMPAIEEGDTVG